MHRILGLDVGAHAVKGVVLEAAFRGFGVKETFSAPVPAGEAPLLERQKAALAAVREKLVADSVAVSLPGTLVATHVLSFPFADARRIEATLGFELEGVLPFDLDEVIYDYQIIGTKNGKTEVLAGVVRKEELGRVLSALADVGVDPQVVSLPPLAYLNLFLHGGVLGVEPVPQGEGPLHAVLDLGGGRSLLCIVSAGHAELARTIAWGGADLTRAVARATGASFESAERWKVEDGVSDQRGAQALERGAAPLVRELRQTLQAYAARTGRQVSELRLTGGASRTRGLPEALAEGLGLAVTPLELAGPAQLGDAGATPELSLATALALRAQGGGKAPRLNLRRGEYAFTRDFEYLRGKLWALGAFAAVLLVLAGLNAFARLNTLSRTAADLDKALCESTQRVLGKCESDYRVALSRLKGKGSPAAAIPKVSAMDIFAAVVANIPGDVEIKLEEIDISAGKARLRGETDAFETVDKIVAGLKSYKCFGEVKRGRVQRKADGSKIEFSLDVAETCEGRS